MTTETTDCDKPVTIKIEADTSEFDAAMKRIGEQLDALTEKAHAAGVFPMIAGANRWFIGGDGSGHTYLVPLVHYTAWNTWLEIPEDDPAAWDVPSYAVRFEGELLSFTDPQLDGERVEQFARRRWGTGKRPVFPEGSILSGYVTFADGIEMYVARGWRSGNLNELDDRISIRIEDGVNWEFGLNGQPITSGIPSVIKFEPALSNQRGWPQSRGQ